MRHFNQFCEYGNWDPANWGSEEKCPSCSCWSPEVEESLKRTSPSRANREGDSQPLPVINEHEDVQSAVIADINRRRSVGIERYGTALQPFNGRSAKLDLYEELLDACMYIKQSLIEDEIEYQRGYEEGYREALEREPAKMIVTGEELERLKRDLLQ